MSSKVPTRSPTHRDIDIGKLAGLGLELEDIAEDGAVSLTKLIELAEDCGKPPSHYLAGMALATELRIADEAPTKLTFCVGKCQQWGALDCVDRAVERWQNGGAKHFTIAVSSCLDRCDQAAVAIFDGPAGQSVVTKANVDEVDQAADLAR